jgi:hypothetical protein
MLHCFELSVMRCIYLSIIYILVCVINDYSWQGMIRRRVLSIQS